MANYFRVSPEEVKNTGAAFDEKGKQMERLAATANETVQTLSGRIWSGEAASKYTAQFNALYNDVAAIQQLITRMVAQLNEIASQYEQAETTSADEAGTLSGSVF